MWLQALSSLRPVSGVGTHHVERRVVPACVALVQRDELAVDRIPEKERADDVCKRCGV